MKPTDFLNNEIHIGDIVAYMQLGYRNLTMGIVETIAPSCMSITIKGKNAYGHESTVRQTIGQVIVVSSLVKALEENDIVHELNVHKLFNS